MVGALIQLKLAVLRHSIKGLNSVLKLFGYGLGMVFAISTILLAANSPGNEEVNTNILCFAFVVWTLGWIVAPLITGGDNTLRPRYFTLLPIQPHRLAVGLIGASFVDATSVFTFIAFLAVVVAGAKLGLVPALIALLALPLQLILLILTSKVIVGVQGEVEKTRLGKEISALAISFGIAFLILGPLTLSKLGPMLLHPWPAFAATIIRILPSSWGIVAVDAAGRSDWLLVIGALGGLAVLCLALLWIWSTLLVSLTTSPTSLGQITAATRVAPLSRLLSSTPLGSTITKEIFSWSRDRLRGRFLRMAFWTGILICIAISYVAGQFMLVFMGAFVAIFAGMLCSNLYGSDGTALWLMLMTPGTEQIDVRARQWAWLIMIAPLVIGLSVLGYVLGGYNQAWTLSFMLAVIPALLGGGAGFVLLMSVISPVVKADPYQRSSNPGNANNNIAGQVFLSWIMTYLVAGSALPAAAFVVIGMLIGNRFVIWIGIWVGVLCGLLLPWILGRVAYKRLEKRGLEILYRFRMGPSTGKTKVVRSKPDNFCGQTQLDGITAKNQIKLLRPYLGRAIWFWSIGGFMLVFEGVIPLIGVLIKSRFEDGRFWYIPWYFPDNIRSLVCIIFIALGGLMVIGGLIIVFALSSHGSRKRKKAVKS
jgi:hypothetical protein